MNWLTLLEGDCRASLRGLAAGSVHLTVCSPPYYGLRSYSTHPQVWGGEPECEHEWNTVRTPRPNGGGGASPKQDTNKGSRVTDYSDRATYSDTCGRCGAWRGELGAEPSPALFIEHLVEVFAEVWRVLRPDGTCWVNLGDCFASQGGPQAKQSKWQVSGASNTQNNGLSRSPVDGLKPKDLCMIPARFAIAMQEAGWYLRQEVTWCKASGMPESVTDRPTSATEKVFLFAKQPSYFYDVDAVRQPYAPSTLPQVGQSYGGLGLKDYEEAGVQNPSDTKRRIIESLERNGGAQLRNYWVLNSEPFVARDYGIKDVDHFASFPSEIPRRAILLGTSEKGCCPHCGAGWVRVTEKTGGNWEERKANGAPMRYGVSPPRSATGTSRLGGSSPRELGWRPSCSCPHTEEDLTPPWCWIRSSAQARASL